MACLMLESGAVRICAFNRPLRSVFIPNQSVDRRTHHDVAASYDQFFGARLPHHSWPFSRVTKRLDQGFHPSGSGAPRCHGVQDGDTKRQGIYPLRSPVGRNPVARDAPYFFRVGLEKYLKQTLTEAIDDPVFKSFSGPHRDKMAFDIGRNA